ncbi:MAG: hypothetical protein NTX48_08055 [Planctomycetales bacterium]|nr:hypothetical protein [Planctomycetales bacterium]
MNEKKPVSAGVAFAAMPVRQKSVFGCTKPGQVADDLQRLKAAHLRESSALKLEIAQLKKRLANRQYAASLKDQAGRMGMSR